MHAARWHARLANNTQTQHKPNTQFEKVYDGCVLVTKKRYAGLAFEEAGGAGHFDAKVRGGLPVLGWP